MQSVVWIDPVVGLLVATAISSTGVRILINARRRLADEALPPDQLAAFEQFSLDAAEQLLVGIAERLYTFALKLGSHGAKVDSRTVDIGERFLRRFGVGVDRPRDLAVVSERPQGLLGHRVDHVAPDELRDIEHV
ncbi:MAG: hypothetical protein WAK93_14225, partial [Solirubrobacteraceae bacterium]